MTHSKDDTGSCCPTLTDSSQDVLLYVYYRLRSRAYRRKDYRVSRPNGSVDMADKFGASGLRANPHHA